MWEIVIKTVLSKIETESAHILQLVLFAL